MRPRPQPFLCMHKPTRQQEHARYVCGGGSPDENEHVMTHVASEPGHMSPRIWSSQGFGPIFTRNVPGDGAGPAPSLAFSIDHQFLTASKSPTPPISPFLQFLGASNSWPPPDPRPSFGKVGRNIRQILRASTSGSAAD